MTHPEHHESFVLATFAASANCRYSNHYISGLSDSYIPVSASALGQYTGYSYVEERTVNNGQDIGFTAYTFENKPDKMVDIHDRYMPNYPGIPYLNNGNPIEISYFNKDDIMLSKQIFNYEKIKVDSIKGLKAYFAPMANGQQVDVKFYDLYSERWILSKKNENQLLSKG
jgi:hypothetical protein